MTLFINFWKKARVYYTLSISRGGGGQAPVPPLDSPLQNNLSFNSTKSFCMVFKLRLYNLLCPTFYMNTEVLNYAANIKYLGFTFSSDKKDDNDMLRQMRVFYTKADRLLRLFHCCSTDVKLALFRSYCACFYCPFYGLIIRSQLIACLELLLTMSIVAY